MKTTLKVYTILILLLALFLPLQTAFADGFSDGQVIFGSNFTLASGETLTGDLVVFGGSVTVEPEAHVIGDIVLFGGSLTIAGEVTGDVVLVGGSGLLKSTAIVAGDLNMVGGSYQTESGARVVGAINNFASPPSISYDLPSQVTVPVIPNIPDDISRSIRSSFNFNPFSDFLWLFLKSMGWAALAALVMLFFDSHTRRVSRAVIYQPVIGSSIGLLTLLVVVVLAVILSITIILIPVALIGVLILAFAIAFGWIAIGLEVGQRTAQALHQDWPLPLSAALGTFVLNFMANGIGFIPCVGWLVPFLIGLLGLGGVLLSRFGTQTYPPSEILPVETETTILPETSTPAS
ncbi:MAG: polymer-forming cytoskeletal protein [Chloroflexota bacterium]